MAEMITKGKEQVRGKSVLLYSGGMDSLMIDYLLKLGNAEYICKSD